MFKKNCWLIWYMVIQNEDCNALKYYGPKVSGTKVLSGWGTNFLVSSPLELVTYNRVCSLLIFQISWFSMMFSFFPWLSWSLILICHQPTWDIHVAPGTAWDNCAHYSWTRNLSQALTTGLPAKFSWFQLHRQAGNHYVSAINVHISRSNVPGVYSFLSCLLFILK